MDASLLNKEFADLTEKEFLAAVKAASLRVSNWTHKALNHLITTQKTPVIWPIKGGGYIIGRYRVTPSNGTWILEDHTQEYKHTFDAKQSAVFYCLCEQANNQKLAREIMTADTTILLLTTDIIHYKRSLERAIKKKDSFGIDIWGSRLDNAKLQLEDASASLKKFIKSAKYNKVGDIHNEIIRDGKSATR